MPFLTQWAIQSLLDGGEPTARIIEQPDEAAARSWVEGFPHSYRLVSRQVSEWSEVAAQGEQAK